ncbi:MAG: RNA polymerase sigma factor [Flavobacteriia bacterium]|nr:RNA polymerase sigma factor [Flavobacteriia bacterium]OJX36331.1 MAG: RNA polymerase subunit sigma-24 [Flavobacteriia bacterium 40-80]
MKFEDIYKAYWQKIFRLCLGYVNDFSSAQDLAQETFITVWQQLPKFRNEAGIGTWIFRIAVNTCLRQIEKEKRMVKTVLPVHLAEEKQESPEPKVQLLYQYISELPENERIIISLELEGIRQAEIANITGFSESNIRVKIHRIKEKLNKKFKENE